MCRISLFNCFIIFLCSACSATKLDESDELTPNEVIIIKGMSNFDLTAGGHASKVCEFDGKNLTPCKSKIQFLPGKHTLIIRDSYLGIPGKSIRITKEFKAGDRYLLGISVLGLGDTEAAIFYKGNVNDSP